MIHQIYGTDAHTMTKTLMEEAQVASMIPSGVGIALKPNLVLARRPEEGATTHPGVLSGCCANLIRALYELERTGSLPRRAVVIGQGWRGKTLEDEVGAGNCCSGAKNCIPGCPPTTESILHGLRSCTNGLSPNHRGQNCR